MNKVFDVVGVGFGPANLALAICLEEMGNPITAHYIDSSSEPVWQSEMLLSGSDIQNNPLRDLVTPRNPKSHFGFINYLKENSRLFEYLNLPSHYPLRAEYAQYIKWAASHFNDQVKNNVRVIAIEPEEFEGQLIWKVCCSDDSYKLARSVVIGTGRTPNIPKVFQPHLGSKVFHLNNYAKRIQELPKTVKRIGVLGASQSAVEICLDLMARYPDKEVYSIHRSFGFRLKDTSPFSDRVYLPDFIDYYHNLPPSGKNNLNNQLRATNYSSADGDVIDNLYMKQYEEKLLGTNRFKIINNTQIENVRLTENGVLILNTHEVNSNEKGSLDLDALVLATGFLDLSNGPQGELIPPLLAPISNCFEKDSNGVIIVSRDYRASSNDQKYGPVFLNGLCESSHGLGDAGSFSLLSLRSEQLAKALVSDLMNRNMTCINPSVNKAVQPNMYTEVEV